MKNDATFKLNEVKENIDTTTIEYINIIGNSNVIPKYLSETVKLKPFEKKICYKLYDSAKRPNKVFILN